MPSESVEKIPKGCFFMFSFPFLKIPIYYEKVSCTWIVGTPFKRSWNRFVKGIINKSGTYFTGHYKENLMVVCCVTNPLFELFSCEVRFKVQTLQTFLGNLFFAHPFQGQWNEIKKLRPKDMFGIWKLKTKTQNH